MKYVVWVLGIGQLIWGVMLGMATESAMHEIYSGVVFGAGSICLSLAVILTKLDDIQ